MIGIRRLAVSFAAITAIGLMPVASTMAASGSSQSSNHDMDHHHVCGLDVAWLQMSAQGDIFEIRGGMIALHKSSDPAVRTLAKTLIKDHTKSLSDAYKLARKYGIKLSNDASPSQEWELEEISEMWGKEFNHDYSELEVLDHRQDIEETTQEVELGCNPDIRSDAKGELPTLRHHLQLSETALASAPWER